jgi:thiol-disulfide isomerase/thioredoxin
MLRRIVCFLAILALAGTGEAAEPAPAEKPAGDEIDLVTTDWAGVQKIVEEHRGKLVVVDIWTTTCATCVSEFPSFVDLRETFGDRIALVAVNCDYDGIAGKPPAHYADKVRTFLTKQDATFDNVLLSTPFIDFLEAANLGTTPAVYVYGRDGKLLKRFDNDDAQVAEEFDIDDVAAFLKSKLK